LILIVAIAQGTLVPLISRKNGGNFNVEIWQAICTSSHHEIATTSFQNDRNSTLKLPPNSHIEQAFKGKSS